METAEKSIDDKVKGLLLINIDRYLEFLDEVIQAPDRITEIKTRLRELYEPENKESFFSESYRSKLDNPEIKELEAEKETLQELASMHEVADIAGYKIMTPGEFSTLQLYRKTALEIDIDRLDKELKASILPMDAIIENTIKDVIEDRYEEYFADYVTGPRPVLVKSKLDIVKFQAFVNLVDFVHYLDRLRNANFDPLPEENNHPAPLVKLTWNGATNRTLYYLIKLLAQNHKGKDGKFLLEGSNENLAAFLKANFTNFENTALGTIQTELKKVLNNPPKSKDAQQTRDILSQIDFNEIDPT